MSVLTVTCPRCHSVGRVPLSSLLALHLVDGDAPGSLAYICDACDEMVDERASEAALAILRASGCDISIVPVREPYPEQRPADRLMTLDDAIELFADVAAIEGGLPAEGAS